MSRDVELTSTHGSFLNSNVCRVAFRAEVCSSESRVERRSSLGSIQSATVGAGLCVESGESCTQRGQSNRVTSANSVSARFPTAAKRSHDGRFERSHQVDVASSIALDSLCHGV